ncbi:MAG: DUF427 domain-containing protein [Anaerolineales bacterium]|nr:DUF427 domain-containing protein [Anaerolineales bacterium]
MVQATWNEAVLAESDQTIIVEGNHYFPPDAVKKEYFTKSESHTMCGWKGLASYYDVQVDGKTYRNAAWYYPSPQPAAKKISGYIAFWHGVKVREE